MDRTNPEAEQTAGSNSETAGDPAGEAPPTSNGTSTASAFYDADRPPFEERPVQSVQDRPTSVPPAIGANLSPADARKEKLCIGAAVAVGLLVVRMVLRRRRRRDRRA